MGKDKENNIIKELLSDEKFVATKDLEKYKQELSKSSGFYCLKAVDISNCLLVGDVEDLLIKIEKEIIYIGVGQITLFKRLNQEIRGKSNGTFFRSIGALLGYLPPKGSLYGKSNKDNYRFDTATRRKIIEWINKNLMLSWYLYNREDIKKLEKCVIRTLKPSLNIEHNPDALPELKEKRKICKEYALHEN